MAYDISASNRRIFEQRSRTDEECDEWLEMRENLVSLERYLKIPLLGCKHCMNGWGGIYGSFSKEEAVRHTERFVDVADSGSLYIECTSCGLGEKFASPEDINQSEYFTILQEINL